MNNNIHLSDRLPQNRALNVTPVDLDPDKPVTSSPIRESFQNNQEILKLPNRHKWKSFNNFFKPPQTYCNCCRTILFTISAILLCGAIAAAITLIAIYVTIPSKESNYGEICSTKQCNQKKLLSCIDGICQCNEFEQQIYSRAINGCETKTILERTHGEYCLIGTTKCLTNTNCYNSICQCNSTAQYWDGNNCLAKKTFNQTCTNRNNTTSSPYYLSSNCVDSIECTECSNESLLECNNATKTCAFTNSLYYFDKTLLKCILPKSYNSY
jgi:hypothetical protein